MAYHGAVSQPSNAPLDPHFLASAATTFANWRARRWGMGDLLDFAEMLAAVRGRWPELSVEQAKEIIAAADRPRGRR